MPALPDDLYAALTSLGNDRAMRGSKAKRLRRELGIDHPGRLQEERFRSKETRHQETGFGRGQRRKFLRAFQGRSKPGEFRGGGD